MRIPVAAIVATVFLSAAISTSAQTADPGKVQVHLYGSGARSCGTWLEDRGNSILHNTELSWVLGWLSASSLFSEALGKHLRDTDANAVGAWVDKYCRENPLNNIAAASGALIDELAKPE
jgi:hypothetical protein